MVSGHGDKRFLGVDPGTRRIGFAISGSGGIASAVAVVAAQPSAAENAKAVLKVAAEYGADAIVLGLPLNMDGSEGPQAFLSQALAKAIGEQAPELPVFLHDERLTSHAADGELSGRDLTRGQKKKRQDAVAAKVLLESFLSSHPE